MMMMTMMMIEVGAKPATFLVVTVDADENLIAILCILK